MKVASEYRVDVVEEGFALASVTLDRALLASRVAVAAHRIAPRGRRVETWSRAPGEDWRLVSHWNGSH